MHTGAIPPLLSCTEVGRLTLFVHLIVEPLEQAASALIFLQRLLGRDHIAALLFIICIYFRIVNLFFVAVNCVKALGATRLVRLLA
jgi:hypothetical protein